MLESASVEQTRQIGWRIGTALRPGHVIALIGQLGAGKTQLVKGIAAGAGMPDPDMVTSPTFVIVNEHPGRVHLYHVDAYRVSGSVELAAIGIDEMLREPAAVVFEWADRVPEVLPDDRLEARLFVTGPASRRIELKATGPSAAELLAALAAPAG